MSYEGIPEDELEPQKEKMLVPALEKDATLQLIENAPNVKVYGLLLSADGKHPLAEVLRTRWSELHHLTGDRILLVAFNPPAEWTAGLEEFWRKQLGSSFDQVWADWKQGIGTEAGASFDYLDLFSEKIKASDLPCMALFTSPGSKEAVVRSIPKWDVDSLYAFLVAQIEAMQDCCDTADEARLDCLRDSLTSISARAKTSMGHYAGKAVDYVKANPAKVASTTLSLAVTLATANVLPLAGPGLAVLKGLKDLVSSK
jgi:hypothetical protein